MYTCISAGDTSSHSSMSLNGSSSASGPPSTTLTRLRKNSELLKTPPKRKTARKHTGRLSADTTSTSPQSKATKTSKSDDASATSPPTKKQRTTRPTVGRQEDSDSCDRCVDSETKKSEREDVQKGVDGGGTMEQDDKPVTEELSGIEEKKEVEAVTENSSKSEEVAATEDMEVGEEEKGQYVQKQVAEKMNTPKRRSTTGTTPGSGKKKKATHPFFSE